MTNETDNEYRVTVECESEVAFDSGECLDQRFFDHLDRYPFDDAAQRLEIDVLLERLFNWLEWAVDRP